MVCRDESGIGSDVSPAADDNLGREVLEVRTKCLKVVQVIDIELYVAGIRYRDPGTHGPGYVPVVSEYALSQQ